MPEFKEICILEMDKEASAKKDIGSLNKIVLKLSATPPREWKAMFEYKWKRCIYSQKPRVSLLGDRLEILANIEDMNKYHLPHMKKIIIQTNEAFSEQATNGVIQAERKKREERNEKKWLDDSSDKLDI